MSTATTVDLWSRSLEIPRYWTTVDGDMPLDVWCRIGFHHVLPLRDLQRRTGVMLFPSLRSGYRSVEWEKAKGRSGSSLHTFPGSSRGAVDLVVWDGTPVRHVVDLLVEYGAWRRICLYSGKGFIHVDYGDQSGVPAARRQLFEGLGSDGKWQFRSFLAEPRV